MNTQGYIIERKKSNLLRYGQVFCFCIIALNLLWAFFADSVLSRFFPFACMGITALMLVEFCKHIKEKVSFGIFIGYIGFIVWSLLEILLLGFVVPNGSETTFLIFRLPGYAMFFVRMFVSILPCMLFVDYNEFNINKIAKMCIFAVLLVSVFFTARAIAVDPDALRARATMENLDAKDILKGTPGYAMVYGYSMMLPAFLHKSRVTAGKTKWFYLFCIFMLLYIIFVAQFATALLIAIVGILVYLYIVSNKQNRVYLLFVFFILGYTVVALDGGADIFRALAKTVKGTLVDKLTDIADILSGSSGGDSVFARTELYEQSWNSFIKSPIIGSILNINFSSGGHSTALDILARGGLLTFIPFCMYIYGTFARMKAYPTYNKAKPAVIASLIQFILMAFLKNMITSMAVFFAFSVMVPLLLKSEETEVIQNEPTEKNNI